MAEFVAAQASVHIVPSLKDFRSRLRTELSSVKQSVSVEVKAQTAKALAEIRAAKLAAESDPIQIRVETVGVTKSITEVARKHQDLQQRMLKGLKLNIAVVGASQLIQLGPVLASLNTSMVELAQSAALLPGAFAGIASSIGTVVVGTRGVTDAFKAYSAAQKDSVDAARKQRDANRSVADATRDLNRATKDAKRSLEDLNAQLRDAPLDEAEAVLNVQEARQEQAKTWGKTALDMQKDNLRVLKSESQLAETRRRNGRLVEDAAEANRKGIKGNDAVVAALERLSKASEDAGTSSGALRDWEQAMGKLAPNAQAFVRQITSMSAAWSQLRSGVQDRLFADLAGDVQQLGTVGLPVLERGLTNIATAINGNLRTALATVKSGQNLSFMDQIFGNTAEAQARLNSGIRPMLDSLIQLSAVGSKHLPNLATAFGVVTNRFDAFIERSANNGSLDRWILNGEKALSELGNSLLNVGSILNSISVAFTGSGGKGLLSHLESGTKRLSEFLKSADGQTQLRQFFVDARAELDKWRPVLSDVVQMSKNFASGVQAWGSTALPVLRTVSQLLASYPALAGGVVYSILAWKTLDPVVRGLGATMQLLGVNFKDVGNAVSGANGLTGKIRALSGVLGTGGALAIAAVAAGGVLYTLADKQDMAATKASRHADEIRRLRTELNSLSGELTSQGLIDKLNALGEFKQASGDRGGPKDIPKLAEGVGVDRSKLAQILTPNQTAARNAELGRLDKITEGALTGTKYWEKNHEAFEKVGITSDVLAKALGGDQAAVDKFNAAFAAGQIPGGGPASLHPESFTLADIQQGADRLGKNVLPGLPDNAQSASRVAGAVRNDVANSNATTNTIRENNTAVGGGATPLKPGNPFAGLGVDNAYTDPVTKGGVIVVNTPLDQLPPDLVKNIETNGGRIEGLPPNNSRSQITLTKDRFALYSGGVPLGPYPVARATGGFMSGPGTGTSDSILARLSDGEFVTRAKSVEKYGAGFMHAINNGDIDPRMLPRFDEGGQGPNFYHDWYPKGVAPATQGPGITNPSPAVQSAKPVPDMSNPGLYDPATGSYSALPSDLGNAGNTTGANVPQVPTAVETRHGLGIAMPGGNQYSALPGPDAAPLNTSGLVPQQQLGIEALPQNLQPVSILSQIGEIIIQAIAGFFGIDLSYLNAFKQGAGDLSRLFGGGASPEAQSLMGGYQNPLPTSQSALTGTVGLPEGIASPVSAQSSAAGRATAMAESMAGKPYTWGGSTLDGTDCSGLVMYVADAYTGKPFSGRDGGTMTEGEKLKARGATIVDDPSQIPPGTLRIGWNNSHTAGTLPDGRNFEASDFGVPIHVGAGAQGYNAKAFTQWAYFPAYASGGMLSGAGTGTSDSMLARVSNGEFITKASSVAKYGSAFMHAINDGAIPREALPGFDEGGPIVIPGMVAPAPQTQTPLPDPQGSQAMQAQQSVGAQDANQQAAPVAAQSGPQTDTATQAVGDAMQGIGSALGGVGGGGPDPGAEAPEGATEEQDPRSILGAAPTNQNHNAPWLQKGIEGAASTIGSALSTAISAAGSVAGAGAPGAGAGASAAGSMAAAGAQMAGQVASGAVNILSSLMVGTLTQGTTQGAYGAPVLPGPPQSTQGPGGPGIVNNYGDIHTANYDEFYRGQQRREAQQQAPILPMR